MTGNQADGEPADSSGGTARSYSFASGAGTCWIGNGEESEGSKKKGCGRACRRCRLGKATARTASGSQGIITSPVSAADNDGTSASPKAGVHLCMSLRATACALVPRRWRLAPGQKSRINLPNRRLAPTPTIWNKTMTTPATDGKMFVNAPYHSAVVSGLAAGYARLGKMALGSSPPKAWLYAPRRWRRGGRRCRHGDQRHAN